MPKKKGSEPTTPQELQAALQKEAEFLNRAAYMPGSYHAVKMHYRRASLLMSLAVMFMEGVFVREKVLRDEGEI